MVEGRNETNVVLISGPTFQNITRNSIIRIKPFHCHFQNTTWKFDKTVDHEFEELLQELSSDVTVKEFLEFDDIHVSLRLTHHLLIGEKNYELNVSSQSKCWTWRQLLRIRRLWRTCNENLFKISSEFRRGFSNTWQIVSFLWREWCRERSFGKCYFIDEKGGKNENRI